jgi:fructoselysine-6-P-deglycase FrlB-like protein
MPENSISEAVAKIEKITEHIYWIGRSAKSGHQFGGSCCSDEITSSIVDSMILQEMALHLSVNNGFNPDAPEGLSKVTMTI